MVSCSLPLHAHRQRKSRPPIDRDFLVSQLLTAKMREHRSVWVNTIFSPICHLRVKAASQCPVHADSTPAHLAGSSLSHVNLRIGRVPLLTSVWSLVMPLGIAFLIWLATNPEVSQQLGLVGAKANLLAHATTSWPTYFGLLAQIVAAGVFIISCLIISWVFGREFADHTLKDMLAVPVQRSSILVAKFIVTAAWSAVLSQLTLIIGLVTGALLGLLESSPAVLLHGGIVMAVTSCRLRFLAAWAGGTCCQLAWRVSY